MCLICEANESKESAAKLASLTRLNCNGCKKVQSIPKELVNLAMLSCYGCTALQTIPKELVNLTMLHCGGCTALRSIPKELVSLAELYCGGCIILYIPSSIAKKFRRKSRGIRIRDWIFRAQYRAARNAEKRAALAVLQNLTSGSSQVFDQNVAAVFNRVRI
jgi:hypothetical protein